MKRHFLKDIERGRLRLWIKGHDIDFQKSKLTAKQIARKAKLELKFKVTGSNVRSIYFKERLQLPCWKPMPRRGTLLSQLPRPVLIENVQSDFSEKRTIARVYASTSAYIRVSRNKVNSTKEIYPDRIFVDLDVNGDLVGVEVI